MSIRWQDKNVAETHNEILGNRSKNRRQNSPGSDSASPGSPRSLRLLPGRLGVLAERDFRRFYTGYTTSLIGSAMSTVALLFAVLGSGGSATDLGYVLAAGVIPQVLFMLGGGVVADRLGRRRVMLGADGLRLIAQATLATTLFITSPPIWLFVLLNAMLGTGEAFFSPALTGLTPAIVSPARLSDANALLSVAQSVARIAGPALAGVLIALTRPATVIAADAVSYGASLLALGLLTIPAMPRSVQSPWRDLADGWRQFLAHAWLVVITIQFALFNLLTWAPYLLLGPVLARDYLGGARAWGIIASAMAAGAILAGLAMVGRSPRRPLVAAVLGTYGYGAPCLMLFLHAPLVGVAAGAFAAGCGSAVFSTYFTTVMQQRIPPDMLARVSAIDLTGAYALGSAGLAVIGPVAAVTGAGAVLGFAALYNTVSSTVVLAVPAVRALRFPRPQA